MQGIRECFRHQPGAEVYPSCKHLFQKNRIFRRQLACGLLQQCPLFLAESNPQSVQRIGSLLRSGQVFLRPVRLNLHAADLAVVQFIA